MPHLEGYKNLTICSIKYNINLLPLYDQTQNAKKIGEYTQALTFLIKHWEFWLKFDTWSTFACSLYTQIVILCKFGNCINHGVEMLKKLLFYSTKR